MIQCACSEQQEYIFKPADLVLFELWLWVSVKKSLDIGDNIHYLGRDVIPFHCRVILIPSLLHTLSPR